MKGSDSDSPHTVDVCENMCASTAFGSGHSDHEFCQLDIVVARWRCSLGEYLLALSAQCPTNGNCSSSPASLERRSDDAFLQLKLQTVFSFVDEFEPSGLVVVVEVGVGWLRLHTERRRRLRRRSVREVGCVSPSSLA